MMFLKNNIFNTFCLKVTFLFEMYFLSILQVTPGQREGKKKKVSGKYLINNEKEHTVPNPLLDHFPS